MAKAKALLAEAGYPDGFKVTLRALADAPFMSAATAIQATLKQAGIDAEIISGSGEQIYGAMRERNFELLVGRGGGGQLPHPDSNLRALVYNPDNSDEAKLTNFQGWRTSFFDPELNTAIDAALVEADPAKQKADYEAIQEQIADGGAVDPALLRGARLGRLPRRPAGLRAEPVVGHRPRRHHQGALTLPGAPVGRARPRLRGDDAMRVTSAGLLAFARQAGTILVTLLGLLVLTFAIGRLMPVDPVRAIVGEEADPATYQQVYQELGMDKPVYVQFATLCRRQVLRGDFGTSLRTGQPVAEDIASVMPATIELATFAILLGAGLGIPLGVWAAVRKNRPTDHIVRVVTLLGHSMPIFWTGMIGLIVFYAWLGWVGGGGRV